jgi:hypothetical protein
LKIERRNIMNKFIALAFLTVLAFSCVGCTPSIAAMKHEQKAVAPAEFDKIKSLAGEWEGISKEDGKETKVDASYEVTSAGTAVMERLFKGTPHEMVTMYYTNDGKLSMTHYCAIGNQPTMKVISADNKSVSFELKKTKGIKSKNDAHMHALKLTFLDPNNIQQDWTYYEDGKSKGITSIKLSRKK